MKAEANYHLILDSNRGIYLPRDFADMIDSKLVKDFDKWESRLIELQDPNHEWYWETWQQVLDNMQIDLFNDGNFWNLHQDGDLFAYKPELLEQSDSEDYKNLFGEHI